MIDLVSFFLPPLIFTAMAYIWTRGWVKVMYLAHRVYRNREPEPPPLSWMELAVVAVAFLFAWPWYEKGFVAENERIDARKRDQEWRRARRRNLR